MQKRTLLTLIILTITVAVIFLGALIPLVWQQVDDLDPLVRENYRRAHEPFGGLFLAAREIETQGERYENRCRDRGELQQVLLQPYYWMMIPGPVVEMCVFKDTEGVVTGVKSVGVANYRSI